MSDLRWGKKHSIESIGAFHEYNAPFIVFLYSEGNCPSDYCIGFIPFEEDHELEEFFEDFDPNEMGYGFKELCVIEIHNTKRLKAVKKVTRLAIDG